MKNHVLDFIEAAYKFQDKWGYTSTLDIDSDTIVDDIQKDICNEPAGIIAEIQNILGEYTDRLADHYEQTGNKRLLKRLNELKKNINNHDKNNL